MKRIVRLVLANLVERSVGVEHLVDVCGPLFRQRRHQLILALEEQKPHRRPGGSNAILRKQRQQRRHHAPHAQQVLAIIRNRAVIAHSPVQLKIQADGERPHFNPL